MRTTKFKLNFMHNMHNLKKVDKKKIRGIIKNIFILIKNNI
jgi:hypothetical protein